MSFLKKITAPNEAILFPMESDILFPMAPLVSARQLNPDSNAILVRIVVFIDENFAGEPENSGFTLSPDGTTAVIEITYGAPEPSSVSRAKYNAFYMDFIYPNETGTAHFVEVSLTDTDPKTSRGTVTTVQQNFD